MAETEQPQQPQQEQQQQGPPGKHPLENSWTLWFDNPQQKQTTSKFGETLRPVFTFQSVEDFWW